MAPPFADKVVAFITVIVAASRICWLESVPPSENKISETPKLDPCAICDSVIAPWVDSTITIISPALSFV